MYPKVNNENILPFRCSYRFNLIALMTPVVTFMRLTILSIILVFVKEPVLQLALAISLNFLVLLYFCRARPYSFKLRGYRIKNYLAIYHQVCILIFQFLMLALGVMNQNNQSAYTKDNYSVYILNFLLAVTIPSLIYNIIRIGIQIYRKIYIQFIQSDLYRNNFPQRWKKNKNKKTRIKKQQKVLIHQRKKNLKSLINGVKNQSSLRPTKEDKQNPQLPVKHKITFFDRDASSINTTSTMSRKQRKQMIKNLFSSGQNSSLLLEKQLQDKYNKIEFKQKQILNEQLQYEQYEQQYQIKLSDLEKYVSNANLIIRQNRLRYKQQQQQQKNNQKIMRKQNNNIPPSHRITEKISFTQYENQSFQQDSRAQNILQDSRVQNILQEGQELNQSNQIAEQIVQINLTKQQKYIRKDN